MNFLICAGNKTKDTSTLCEHHQWVSDILKQMKSEQSWNKSFLEGCHYCWIGKDQNRILSWKIFQFVKFVFLLFCFLIYFLVSRVVDFQNHAYRVEHAQIGDEWIDEDQAKLDERWIPEESFFGTKIIVEFWKRIEKKEAKEEDEAKQEVENEAKQEVEEEDEANVEAQEEDETEDVDSNSSATQSENEASSSSLEDDSDSDSDADASMLGAENIFDEKTEDIEQNFDGRILNTAMHEQRFFGKYFQYRPS